MKTQLWQRKQGNRKVIEYCMEMVGLWQKLDLNNEEQWECTNDGVRYKKKFESERAFEFLAGLDRDLGDVRGRLLGRRPLSSP